jgi:hypothetical protein
MRLQLQRRADRFLSKEHCVERQSAGAGEQEENRARKVDAGKFPRRAAHAHVRVAGRDVDHARGDGHGDRQTERRHARQQAEDEQDPAADLLIGGPTAHDGIDVSWKLISNEWISARTYAERIRRLSGGLFGLPRLDGTTVFADSSADMLTGGGGLDWFFADMTLDTTDRLPTERLN